MDGLGLALRLEVCKPDGITPDRELTDRIFAEGMAGNLEARGRKYGLVLDVGGYYKNVFTLAPSFTITQEEMDLGFELLDQLFQRCVWLRLGKRENGTRETRYGTRARGEGARVPGIRVSDRRHGSRIIIGLALSSMGIALE